MKKSAKILYISQEIYPYLPETKMSTIGRYLPQAMQERGHETRTFMPKFGSINERRNQLHEVIRLSGMNLIIDDTDHPLIIKVASIQAARLQVYFIDNEDYFHRKELVSDAKGKEFEDNDERIIFFTRGVLETVKKLRWAPDIIHCQGWMSALAPLYIKHAYNDNPFFNKAKIVYSVFDDEFNTPLRDSFKTKMLIDGVEPSLLNGFKETPTDFLSLSKLAIDFSDAVIQASPEMNSGVMQHVDNKNKKFLSYHNEETYADAYLDLYNSLI